MAADARDDHGAADDELSATGFHARRLDLRTICSKISGAVALKRHGASRLVQHGELGISHQTLEVSKKPKDRRACAQTLPLAETATRSAND